MTNLTNNYRKNYLTSPLRADIVGSFLRPKVLKEARKNFLDGKITKEQLTSVEDAAIARLVHKQIEHGLKAVTDGEFRRSWWHLDFFAGLQGTEYFTPENGFIFHNGETRAGGIRFINKIAYNENHPFFSGFEYLASITPDNILAKQTIPSPTVLFPNPAAEIYDEFYSDDFESFIADVSSAYQDTINRFYEMGCRYIQLDDTSWGMWTSFSVEQDKTDVLPELRPLANAGVQIINTIADNKPDDLLLTMHVCRGNYDSDWAGAGAYDSVAKYLGQLHIDGYFLEYDDERSGGFAPLKSISANGQNQKVILGLITTKSPTLEDSTFLKQRIKEASKYVSLENLCLSPQCGFASTEEGNKLSEEDQWHKINLTVETAKSVWPTRS